MTTATYTHAENAQFLAELADKLSHADIVSEEQVERLSDLAAREAEQDPAYVAYVNAKVRAALANPGRRHTQQEAEAIVKAWCK
jgi:hypothetical protein